MGHCKYHRPFDGIREEMDCYNYSQILGGFNIIRKNDRLKSEVLLRLWFSEIKTP